jgi:N-acetyl sugar amidotransferase
MEDGPQSKFFFMIFWCKNCLNASTRPRITFDKRGYCNACQWSEEKEKITWKKRQDVLKKLFKKNKKNKYDCIVPVSGGKDGSYVSYILKKKFGIRPLTITVRPPLELNLGSNNLKNFINSGYDHIHISPNQKVMYELNKFGFKFKGFPYYGWLIAIHTSVLKLAASLNINLIFYGEDGEVEYGGTNKTKNKPFYDSETIKKIYLEGGYDLLIKKINAKKSEKFFFEFPSDSELKKIKITHWSYFEKWDSYRNYVVAKEHCGLEENEKTNMGTFTNFAQNDQAFYALHAYIMYLKFGFGRATQDAGIEVRRGAMTRNQAINLVKLYDNHYPDEYIKLYLDYYKMSKSEFDKVLDKWVNKKLFKKIKNRWQPNFSVE